MASEDGWPAEPYLPFFVDQTVPRRWVVPRASLWRQNEIIFGTTTLAAASFLVLLMGTSHADPQANAVPAPEKAGGAGPVETFLKFYGPTKMPKAFAV
jgi:hypothetical protein